MADGICVVVGLEDIIEAWYPITTSIGQLSQNTNKQVMFCGELRLCSKLLLQY